MFICLNFKKKTEYEKKKQIYNYSEKLHWVVSEKKSFF